MPETPYGYQPEPDGDFMVGALVVIFTLLALAFGWDYLIAKVLAIFG